MGVARSRRPEPEVRGHPGGQGLGPRSRRLSEPRPPRRPGAKQHSLKPWVRDWLGVI